MTSDELILHEIRIASRMVTLARTVAVVADTQHDVLDEICARAHRMIDEARNRKPAEKD